MAMAPPERRECVPTSSGEKPSLATPTFRHLALMTAMMLDALTEQRSRYFLMGVVGSHPCSCRRRELLMLALTGQDAA